MKYFISIIILAVSLSLNAQDSVKIYNPSADAAGELAAAIAKAGTENKHVLVQVGGNWCSWCIRLHGFMHSNQQIDSLLKADYVLIRINYSPENRNPEVLASLEYPQRFGFPVLLVVDQKGRRLHTQDSGLLEQGNGYDADKIKRFLLSWNQAAVNPVKK